MVVLTQSLPIRLVPEQRSVPLVRNNVVNDSCSREPSDSLAFNTKWMQDEVAPPCRPPPGVIASARSRSTPLIRFFALLNAMFLTASMSWVHQDRAARKSARMRRRKGTHAAFLFPWRSTVAARLMESFCWRSRGSRPFSITYPGRFCSW